MQPGFRYIRFAERLLLGDGELLVATLALAALAWSVLWLVARLHRGGRPGLSGRVLFGLTAALLVAVVGASQVTAFVLAPLSEYPTWIALALAFPLLFVSTAPGAWSAGALLLGVALVTRTNQAPAILFLLVVFVARAWTLRRRAAMVAGLIFALVALLPIVHNRYYGGRWVPLTTAAAVPAALVISPFDLPTLTHDAEARNTLWFQAQSVLALVPMRGERSLPLMLHGLQAAWLLALLRLLVVRGPGWPRARLLMLLPLLYLGVHLFYIVEVTTPATSWWATWPWAW